MQNKGWKFVFLFLPLVFSACGLNDVQQNSGYFIFFMDGRARIITGEGGVSFSHAGISPSREWFFSKMRTAGVPFEERTQREFDPNRISTWVAHGLTFGNYLEENVTGGKTNLLLLERNDDTDVVLFVGFARSFHSEYDPDNYPTWKVPDGVEHLPKHHATIDFDQLYFMEKGVYVFLTSDHLNGVLMWRVHEKTMEEVNDMIREINHLFESDD